MKQPMSKAPKPLGTEGQRLWNELQKSFDLDGCEPLLTELCRVADRLAEIRAEIARAGVANAGRLLDVEAKLSGQFRMLWRSLGLTDAEKEPKKIGRPPGSGFGRLEHLKNA
jgi:hypothetical protein